MSENPRAGGGDLYAQLLQQMRAEAESNPPGNVSFEHVVRYIDRAESRWHGRRAAVTGLLLLTIGLALLSLLLHPIVPWVCSSLTWVDLAHGLALPIASLVGAMLLMRRTSAGAQMLLRALLWSSLLLGALATYAEPGVLPVVSFGGAMACGAALLLLGEHGLEPERYTGSFVPVAHRDALTLVMILAVADAQMLVSWAQASRWYYPAPGVLGLSMLVGIAGLYRLRAWGLLFNAVANVGIAVVALLGLLSVPSPVVFAVATTAALQLALVVPVLWSIRAGEAIERPRLARVGRLVARIVVMALMIGTVVAISTMSAADVAMTCLR